MEQRTLTAEERDLLERILKEQGPMNDLGLTLAWSAVQVSLVLVPAAALHALASRRSPASGAWVASLSLGLVVALSLLSLAPRAGASAAGDRPGRDVASRPAGAPVRRGLVGRSSGPEDARPRLVARGASGRLGAARDDGGRAGGPLPAVGERAGGRRAGRDGGGPAPAGRRPVGGPRSAGDGRGRSTTAALSALLEELRGRLGCRRRVEVRETPDLTTPATAGWRRPVVLLPEDWRSWDGHERRAVLAHELAHVCRDDYLTGLVARLALALHFYHPLVHWLAARLRLEQELAADALGARFAGGRTSLPAKPVAAGAAAGRTFPVLAGQGVPAGEGDLDQEDRHVA